jgi:hypothetical protein
MSRNNSTKFQKFCKVCQDAGKPESEYRSHFIRETRDPNSRVVCPTLLATECRYCFKKGHTIKFCNAIKQNNTNTNYTRNNTNINKNMEKPVNKNTNITTNKKMTNAFTCLDDDSDDEQFPQLCAPSNKVNNYIVPIASQKLFTPHSPTTSPPPHSLVKFAPLDKTTNYSNINIVQPPKHLQVNRQMKSWADDSSDEDEEFNFNTGYNFNNTIKIEITQQYNQQQLEDELYEEAGDEMWRYKA